MRAVLLTGLLLAVVLSVGGFLALGVPARTGVPAIDLRVQTADGPRAERRRERAARSRPAAGATPAPAPAPAPVGDDVDDNDDDDRDPADDD
jgi:hypothetical protein